MLGLRVASRSSARCLTPLASRSHSRITRICSQWLGKQIGRALLPSQVPLLRQQAFRTAHTQASTATVECGSCGASQSSDPRRYALACANCSAILDVDYAGATHYSLLGLEVAFNLKLADLDSSYKNLQKVFHPDRHAARGDSLQAELAERHSARLNEAVANLRSPLLRARYWMELNGVRVLEEDQRMTDQATMMEVMEASEEIEEAENQEEIDALTKQFSDKIASIESKLSELFERKDWEAATTVIERLQMLTRVHERMNEWKPPSK